jgi:hypothetical protein
VGCWAVLSSAERWRVMLSLQRLHLANWVKSAFFWK